MKFSKTYNRKFSLTRQILEYIESQLLLTLLYFRQKIAKRYNFGLKIATQYEIWPKIANRYTPSVHIGLSFDKFWICR